MSGKGRLGGVGGDIEGGDVGCELGLWVDIDEDAGGYGVACCDVEWGGHVGGHVSEDTVDAAAEDRVDGATHTEVGDVGGAATR